MTDTQEFRPFQNESAKKQAFFYTIPLQSWRRKAAIKLIKRHNEFDINRTGSYHPLKVTVGLFLSANRLTSVAILYILHQAL